MTLSSLLMISLSANITAAHAEPLPDQRLIVRWKQGAVPQALTQGSNPRRLPFASAATPLLPLKLARDHGQTQVYAIEGGATQAAAQSAAATLLNDTRVLSAELDHVVYPSADYERNASLQWHRSEAAQGGVNATTAWNASTGQGIRVAVVDTGVTATHDLAALLPGYDFVSEDAGSFDGNGWDSDPSPDHETSCGYGWHGTFVASIVAALANNGRGTAGIAPGAQIVPVRALGSCGGWASDTAFALAWAAGVHVDGAPDNPYPARVVNASFGRSGTCAAYEQDAIDQAAAKGAIIVASAGNNAGAVTVPAQCQGVVTVTATTLGHKRTSYASTGPEVTLAAPGGGNGFDSSAGPAIYSSGVDENLQEMDALGATGTSLSAPIVSGVVALMLQVRPYASIAELKQALTSSAQPFEAGSGCETNCGAGIVDANAAVQMIQALSPLGRTALLQGQSASSNNNQSQSNQETGSVSSNPAGGGAISIGFGIALFLATVSAAMLRLKKVQVLLPNQFSICKPSTRSQ